MAAQSARTIECRTNSKSHEMKVTAHTVFTAVMLLVIVVSGAILFMCLVGMIKFNDPSIKAAWVEITSQILNACFTLQALMVQPERLMLIIWTYKWRKALNSKDNIECKVNALKIHNSVKAVSLLTVFREGASITHLESIEDVTPTWKWGLILALLNAQCIFQYPVI